MKALALVLEAGLACFLYVLCTHLVSLHQTQPPLEVIDLASKDFGELVRSAEAWGSVRKSRTGPHVTSTTSNTSSLIYSSPFSVLLNKDCTVFTATTARAAIGAFYNLTLVTINTSCATTMLSMICSGYSVADANAYCQVIYNNIITPNSTLYNELAPLVNATNTTRSFPGGKSSNHALFGLLALLAIPVILIGAGAVWWCRRDTGGPPVPTEENGLKVPKSLDEQYVGVESLTYGAVGTTTTPEDPPPLWATPSATPAQIRI
jgi:hypothetical protein